jgi:hypothetical protein
MQDYRAKINDDFSDIKNAIIANAISNRMGAGFPHSYPIPAFLPALPATTLNDPWGNPYVYVQNSVAPMPLIDNTTLGNVVAYTVTSYGSDGVVGGNDDIQSIITVNQLQDAFAKAGW